MADMKLVRLLAEKIGIKTVGELDEFKKITEVTTNDMLLKRLALYVATDTTFAEVLEYKRLSNKE
jgi:hypothetical protein